MPDPTSTAAGTATFAAIGASLPVLASAPQVAPMIFIFGISIGLRADVLLAGFGGAVAAIAFFNAVPSSGDTWRELVNTTARRTWYVLASSITAGYLTPLLMLLDGDKIRIPETLMLSVAFVVGGGAQRIFGRFVKRAEDKIAPAAAGGGDA